jgi:uncharacterized membrane protein
MNNAPSVAAQIIVTIIPIVGIVMGCTVVFFYLLWNYNQNKLLIDKGLYRQTSFNMSAFSLLTGLLLTGIGLVLSVFIIIMEGKTYNLLGGLITFVIGLCFLTYYAVRKNNPKK